MVIVCEQCGRKGTLDEEPYHGKTLKLRCPYCSSEFLYAISQNGDGPEVVGEPLISPVVSAHHVSSEFEQETMDAVIEAKRIARLIISEIKLYNQEKIEKAANRKEVLDLLKNELMKGKQHYNDRVASRLPVGPDYFTETIKEILLAGKN